MCCLECHHIQGKFFPVEGGTKFLRNLRHNVTSQKLSSLSAQEEPKIALRLMFLFTYGTVCTDRMISE
jgi:hypothetical protein